METITGFSASLLQSLNGDTAKVAEVGNMAVTDMADNAIMTNVSQVEAYGKNLNQVQLQTREIFRKLQQQTKSIGNTWKDSQFQMFEQRFNQDIVKKINEITSAMEQQANYIKGAVELQRSYQNLKVR